MKLRRFGVLVGILVLSAGVGQAQNARTLDLSFHDGLVTLSANNVTVRDILNEWARKGGSTIVNADKLGGSPVILMEFKDQPEAEVLRALLRDAPGYGIAMRATASETQSTVQTVFLLATRTSPASNSYVAPPPTQQPFQAPTVPQAVPRLIQGSPDNEIPPVTNLNGTTPPMTPGADGKQDPNLRTNGNGVVTSVRPGVIIPVQGVPPGSTGPGTTPPTTTGRGRGRQGGGGGGGR